jgi:hypothetical protein
VNDPADHPAIVCPSRARLILRKKRLNRRHCASLSQNSFAMTLPNHRFGLNHDQTKSSMA